MAAALRGGAWRAALAGGAQPRRRVLRWRAASSGGVRYAARAAVLLVIAAAAAGEPRADDGTTERFVRCYREPHCVSADDDCCAPNGERMGCRFGLHVRATGRACGGIYDNGDFECCATQDLLAQWSAGYAALLHAAATQRLPEEGSSAGVRADYGGPSSKHFAPLLTRVCAGACHDAASRWSPLARKIGPRNVTSAQECHALCEDRAADGCQVYTHVPALAACELKGALPLPGVADAEDDSAGALFSNAVTSHVLWLPFPFAGADAMPYHALRNWDEEAPDCAVYGHALYGCVLAAYGTTAYVSQGIALGWWSRPEAKAAAPRLVEMLTPDVCAALCAREGDACIGWTYLPFDPPKSQRAEAQKFYGGVTAGFIGKAACILMSNDTCSSPWTIPASSWNGLVDVSSEAPFALSAFSGIQRCASQDMPKIERSAPALPGSSTCGHKRCRRAFVGGSSSAFHGDTFIPVEEGQSVPACYYHMFSPEQVVRCAEDKSTWMFIEGGSNAILVALNAINWLAPGFLSPIRDQVRTGSFTIIDAVFDAAPVGKPVHYANANFEAYQNGTIGGDGWTFNAKMMDLLNHTLYKAPTGKFRITIVNGQYWENAAKMLELFASSTGPEGQWGQTGGTVNRIYMTQIGTWYLACGVHRSPICNREPMLGIGLEESVDLFTKELDSFLTVADRLCIDGMKCLLLSSIYHPYNKPIEDVLRTRIRELSPDDDIWQGGVAMLDAHVLSALKLNEARVFALLGRRLAVASGSGTRRRTGGSRARPPPLRG